MISEKLAEVKLSTKSSNYYSKFIFFSCNKKKIKNLPNLHIKLHRFLRIFMHV